MLVHNNIAILVLLTLITAKGTAHEGEDHYSSSISSSNSTSSSSTASFFNGSSSSGFFDGSSSSGSGDWSHIHPITVGETADPDMVFGKFSRYPKRPFGKMGAHPVIYQCPMHPQIWLNGPGKCSICSMPLEPKIR